MFNIWCLFVVISSTFLGVLAFVVGLLLASSSLEKGGQWGAVSIVFGVIFIGLAVVFHRFRTKQTTKT